jgi:Protein of unknown function (DUF3102)
MSESTVQELLSSASLCILGVDPGLTGALEFYFPAHDAISAEVEDMPVVASDVDAATLAARIAQMRPDIAIVELASSRPGQGVASWLQVRVRLWHGARCHRIERRSAPPRLAGEVETHLFARLRQGGKPGPGATPLAKPQRPIWPQGGSRPSRGRADRAIRRRANRQRRGAVMTGGQPEIGDNSLADLAARIKAEHEAAEAANKRGLEHAINAGRLLLEAKAQVTHGRWLPWLGEHCRVPERTAQAYMQVARSFDGPVGKPSPSQGQAPGGDDAKALRVADLSFRNALQSLAVDRAKFVGREIRHMRREDARSRFTLETPQALLPSPAGRMMRVARNPAERRWMLACGPNISRAKLKERERVARETAVVEELERQRSDLVDQAAELEAEAKRLRQEAESLQKEITVEIKKAIGPAEPFTVTYKFQADEETDAEIASLSEEERVDRLLAARGAIDESLEETERGYWGDMTLMGSQPTSPGPGGPRFTGWTKIGSPEWLDELFPDWNAKSSGAPS